jgi:hypothetical protein
MFSTVAPAQWILGVLWPALVTAEKLIIAPGSLQDTVVEATNSIFAVLIVIFRVPSTSGGTVQKAVAIQADAPVGQPAVVAPQGTK